MRSGERVGSRHARLRADGQVRLRLATLHVDGGGAGQIANCNTVRSGGVVGLQVATPRVLG